MEWHKTLHGGSGASQRYWQYLCLTWELNNGAWHVFGADGYAKSGLVFDPALGGYFYIDINTGMKTGWQLIDGKWYYSNPISDSKRGIMFTDAWIDGGM